MEHNDLLSAPCEEEGSKNLKSDYATNDTVCNDEDKRRWKLFLRQLLVCSGVWVSYFMFGLNIGSPTVMIPQIRREANSSDIINDEMASWLSSLQPYSGMLWAFLLPGLTQLAGRRITLLVIAGTSLVGYIILLGSTTVRDLLISEAMYGLLTTSCHTILPIIITEYSQLRYRGIFLTLKTASFFWGIWVSNAIGTFFYWKYIAVLGICCNVYTIVTPLFWNESPYWLATKQRFDDCVVSFRYLKGYGPCVEKELQELLKHHEYSSQSSTEKSKINVKGIIRKFLRTLRNEQFYKPTLVSLLMMTLYHSSGKMACTIYAIELIKKITQSEATAYKGMLILDGVTVFGMFMGCILSRFLKRRTLMIGCSCSGVLFLFIISLYLYLIKLGFITESSIVSILLLTIYQLSISCGPIILSSSIYSEMVPINYIGCNIFCMGFYSVFLMGSMIKFSPLMFSYLGLHVAFLVYGICACICTCLVYLYLPETKDKTLKEIEDYFKNSSKNRGVRKKRRELMTDR